MFRPELAAVKAVVWWSPCLACLLASSYPPPAPAAAETPWLLSWFSPSLSQLGCRAAPCSHYPLPSSCPLGIPAADLPSKTLDASQI